jgi:hypothetical protein
LVAFYARNDHLELTIPYEFLGVPHSYVPDFLVRLSSGTNLLLEIKGQHRPQDGAKHQAAKRWVAAVNHWGEMGRWAHHVCRDPQMLREELQASRWPSRRTSVSTTPPSTGDGRDVPADLRHDQRGAVRAVGGRPQSVDRVLP